MMCLTGTGVVREQYLIPSSTNIDRVLSRGPIKLLLSLMPAFELNLKVLFQRIINKIYVISSTRRWGMLDLSTRLHSHLGTMCGNSKT